MPHDHHALQQALFEDTPPSPPGLRLQNGFLTDDEQAQLLALLQTLPLQQARHQQYTARRRVVAWTALAEPPAEADAAAAAQHTTSGDPRTAPPSRSHAAPLHQLPPALQALRDRLAAWAGMRSQAIVHVLVSQYQPGTPLGWHRDAPQYGSVLGVSLGGAARMRWRPWPVQPAVWPLVLWLPAGSAYLMRDAARWAWQHSLPPVPALRWSVTMRTAR